MSDTYKVVYSAAAQDDIRAIYTYIAYELDAKQTAHDQVNRIRSLVRKLNKMPERHSAVDWEPWASLDMRKVPVDNYVVFYLVDKTHKVVTVVRGFYGGSDIEGIMREVSVP